MWSEVNQKREFCILGHEIFHKELLFKIEIINCLYMISWPLGFYLVKNLVPRIQNSRFWLTSDHITTPNLYVSPTFFPSSPHFHSLHVTRIFSVKRPHIYFEIFHSSQVFYSYDSVMVYKIFLWPFYAKNTGHM